MTALLIGAASALWFGILMAISPCPMAGNVVAISYIGKRLGNPRQVLLGGALYAVGRTVAYVGLAVVILAGLGSVPRVSTFLQGYMNKVLGPVLVVVGLFLLELLKFGRGGSGVGEKLGKKVEGWGLVGALALGIILALSFCPISAALFFGSLISLSIKYGSRVLLPAVFGVGTALPVFAFAVIIGLGIGSLGAAFHKVQKFEWWARRVTGAVFVLVGIYYCLQYIFEVF
ncbi:MAG: sulfite exporter TauE/SafE family protein [candidate division Zixibacteria bacterium]|nr:sulfite exporter TauE/SafE family protein [candidate division Zixibacteria bacterium]